MAKQIASNRQAIGVSNSYSVSDHAKTNENGIVGQIELRRAAIFAVADVQVDPNVALQNAKMDFEVLLE
ncbi:MAG: hypothetical protein AAF961_07890 [Planctomycetota bacterium]